MSPRLPAPRGPITEILCHRLTRPTTGQSIRFEIPADPAVSEDLQLALHICYGLHYDGFAGIDDGWEWDPSMLGLRAALEEAFLSVLISEAKAGANGPGICGGLPDIIRRVRLLLGDSSGRSLSHYMAAEGNLDQLREFVIHRSIYQRKEADAHTWAIPRLRGLAKSSLVTLQADEYGGGRPGCTHAELFANTMVALDLDPTPGVYINDVPGVTLATDNLVSCFGLHRRWRGALVGHLAAFEMTSVVPMGRYAAAVRRLIGREDAAEFYDVHVVADVLHEQIAATDLIGGLAAQRSRCASRRALWGGCFAHSGRTHEFSPLLSLVEGAILSDQWRNL